MILIIFFFAPDKPVELDSGSRVIMGTFARVIAVASDIEKAQRCIDAAFEQLQDIEKLMSVYDSNSQLSMVNRLAFNEPVKVDQNLFHVLERSVYFSRTSDGAFDVTVGPMVDLWRESGKKNTEPVEEEINNAILKVGYEKLILDANNLTVRFAVEGMKIDLGGIAKGYSVDKAIESLNKNGALGGLVDVGGNIRCFGIAAGRKENWLIGLQDPNITDEQMESKQVLLTLKLTDEAVATSGHYRRFNVIEGHKHSHIIDTFLGQSSDKLSSVTIITGNAIDADAFSTAVSVLGEEKGLELINSLENTEAVLITPAPEYKMILTDGMSKYIYKP
jgi:thiamine biosynthesis lipoprotein